MKNIGFVQKKMYQEMILFGIKPSNHLVYQKNQNSVKYEVDTCNTFSILVEKNICGQESEKSDKMFANSPSTD